MNLNDLVHIHYEPEEYKEDLDRFKEKYPSVAGALEVCVTIMTVHPRRFADAEKTYYDLINLVDQILPVEKKVVNMYNNLYLCGREKYIEYLSGRVDDD